jgi:hypothetical protein
MSVSYLGLLCVLACCTFLLLLAAPVVEGGVGWGVRMRYKNWGRKSGNREERSGTGHTHMREHAHAHTHTHTRTHTPALLLVLLSFHFAWCTITLWTRAQAHTHTLSLTHSQSLLEREAHTHTRTNTCTRTPPPPHTLKHTCTCTRNLIFILNFFFRLKFDVWSWLVAIFSWPITTHQYAYMTASTYLEYIDLSGRFPVLFLFLHAMHIEPQQSHGRHSPYRLCYMCLSFCIVLSLHFCFPVWLAGSCLIWTLILFVLYAGFLLWDNRMTRMNSTDWCNIAKRETREQWGGEIEDAHWGDNDKLYCFRFLCLSRVQIKEWVIRRAG